MRIQSRRRTFRACSPFATQVVDVEAHFTFNNHWISVCLKQLDILGSMVCSTSWCGYFSKQESVHRSSFHFALADVHMAELNYHVDGRKCRPQPMSTSFHSSFIKGHWASRLEAARKSSFWTLEGNTMRSLNRKKGLKRRVPLQFRRRNYNCPIASADLLQ